MPDSLAERVKEKARRLGFDLVGICGPEPPASLGVLRQWVADGNHGEMHYMQESLPLRADLNNVLPGVQSVVAVGLNYNQDPPPGDVRIARYALGRDYHKVLRHKLKALASSMEPHTPGSKWRACVDSAPVMEREYAHRAGLGWFGKNTCLIDSKRGSWFLIGILLTTATIDKDKQASGGCGNCTACIDSCPTGAIVNRHGVWQVNARNCISYLTIEKRGEFSVEEAQWVGEWTFGCDVCQEVCPFNKPRPNQPLRSQSTQEPDFLDRRDFGKLQNLLDLTHAEWDALTRGSAVRRAGFEGIRRNAAANRRNRSSS